MMNKNTKSLITDWEGTVVIVGLNHRSLKGCLSQIQSL